MADKNCLAGPSHGVKHARSAICRRAHQLRPGGIETHVEDLVVVPTQRVDALPRGYIPDLACPVDGAANAQVCAVVKLRIHTQYGFTTGRCQQQHRIHGINNESTGLGGGGGAKSGCGARTWVLDISP